MNEVIIYFILFIVIIIIYNKIKNQNIKYIDKNIQNNNNLIINGNTNTNNNITNNDTHEEIITILHGDTPNLRGYLDEYRMINIDEQGGSKPFNNIFIDDNNLTANQVNYNKYESYRKKPVCLKK